MVRKRSTVAALTTALVTLALTPVPMTTAGAQTAGRSSTDPVAIALDHLAANAADLGVTRADVTDLAVASSYESSHNRVTHVNLSQRFESLEVFGSYATVNVAEDGEVLFVGDSLVTGLSAVTPAAPRVDAPDAVAAAAQELELDDPDGLRVIDGPTGRAQKTVVSKAGISSTPIPARLGWHPAKSGLRLAWQLTIDDTSDSHLWNATVDADTGELLKSDDWTERHSAKELTATLARGLKSASPGALTSPDPVDDGSSYRVFELPKESPNDGGRTLVNNPADATASPFGWHDTDGVAGPEFTITRGNNVHAYLDQDNNSAPDFGGAPFEAHTGEHYVYSNAADVSYKRLTREVAVPGAGGSLTFWTSYDTEADWDHLFVEARTAAGDDWTTLRDANGHTTQATGESCRAGWRELHPHLDHYQTLAAGACTPTGTTGEWHAASGDSEGWQEWSVDLSAWAGESVEVSIAYVSDWAAQEDGVAVDDVTLPDGTSTSFETGLDGWEVTGPPAGSAPNPNNWVRTDPSSLPVGDTDGGPGLDFDFPADLNEHAQNYRDAVVTNLHYWNNVVHDVTYRYGFDEESGNFQANNYGRGGTEGDYVRAEAADGGGTNNANFSTPIETPTSGGTPRMQMYLWPGAQFGLPNEVVVDGLGSFGAQFARFSPAPTVAGLPGQTIVYASSGCDAGLYPDPLPPSNWVVIVDGGTAACSYLQRVQAAEALGANAVIVAHNTTAAPPILSSPLVGVPAGIPAVGISQADGNAIKAAVAAGPTTANVRKNPDHPGIRDGDLENGIIIHEYGHGVSLRLTGGPTVNCLTGNEQAGEGWSDYLAIAMLLDPALDDPEGPRGMGPYALFQDSRQGAGIRPRPYSRNMAIQPFTYDSIKTRGWLEGSSLALPHGLGHGWAAVLWDLTWDLIDRHGFNPDVYGDWDTGGNNRALQYVVDGLKFQGCGPGLVVARDAIIAAADELSEGEDTCTVWASFARRGLGFSAVQGTTNRNDNTEAFDTHPDCRAGFFGGVADPPTINPINRGEAIDMEFDAGGDRGLDLLASNSPYSREVDCDTLRTETPGAEFITPRPLPVPAETPGNSRLSYDPTTDRYTFPWKTLEEWGGTCREFVLTRDDGVQHRAYFRVQANPAFGVSGRVLDGDGQPVVHASVTLDGPVLSRTTTDDNGFYSFEGVPRGTYEATASASRCEPQTQTLDLSRTTTLNFSLNCAVWVARYDGPAGGSDAGQAQGVSADGSRVFVTGRSVGVGTSNDYATAAYDAATGEQLWVARYDGPAGGSDVAWALGVSPDGSRVFVTGQSGVGTPADYATVAYDAATGEELWVARYDGPAGGSDVARALGVSADGSRVFVTGDSGGAGTGADYATVAYDAATGEQLWVARYDRPVGGSDVAEALSVSRDGSRVYVTGRSTGVGTGNDYATVAYDAATGEELWVGRYDGPVDGARATDTAWALGVSADGSRVFVTGQSAGVGTGNDYATVAYDAATGDQLWVGRYDGPAGGSDVAGSLGVNPDGSRVFVTGDSAGVGTGTDYATVAYDTDNGEELWVGRYDGPGNGGDFAVELGVSANGSRVHVTGQSPGVGTGGADYATVAYDTDNGEELWVGRYDGPASGIDTAEALSVSPDGSRVFVTGQSTGVGTGTEYATVAYSAFLNGGASKR